MGENLRHAVEGLIFKAFGGADDELAPAQVIADANESRVKELGRDDGDHDVGGSDGSAVGSHGDPGGDGKAGKKLGVFSGVENLAGELGGVRPEGDLVAAAAVERERDGGSPGA